VAAVQNSRATERRSNLRGIFMADIDDRLAVLERRIALLEDQVAIYQLMSAYGPAADSGSTERATSLWTEAGVYDLHSRVMTGRGEIGSSRANGTRA
jgi:hypothetical protein